MPSEGESTLSNEMVGCLSVGVGLLTLIGALVHAGFTTSMVCMLVVGSTGSSQKCGSVFRMLKPCSEFRTSKFAQLLSRQESALEILSSKTAVLWQFQHAR